MRQTRPETGATARSPACRAGMVLAALCAGSPAAALEDAASGASVPPPRILIAQAGDPLPTAREIWRHLPELGIDPAPPADPSVSSSPPAPRPEAPRAGTSPVTRAAAPPAAPSAPAASRTLAQARLVIHSSSAAASDAVSGAVRRLRDAGTAEVEFRQVPFAMTLRQLRFFYAEDRAIAQRVATLIAPGNPVEIADFTHFRPLPRIGTVELWLP